MPHEAVDVGVSGDWAVKKIPLGRFTTPIAAARAYDTEALAVFGKFARLNFGRSA